MKKSLLHTWIERISHPKGTAVMIRWTLSWAVASVGWDYVRFTESDASGGDRKVEPNKFGRFLVDGWALANLL